MFSSISAIFTFVGQWLERTAKRDTGTGEPLTLVDIAGMRIRQSVTAELGKSYLAVKAAILGTMSPKLLSKELLREEIEAERKRLESGS
ncbi:hypothetical protein [Neorhodopirellula lusitana]|uniref:hypothetical protein n=1 Tax=Neorhodopirellula lusitana TaxID=445327 RepID=UPI003851362B